MFSRRSRGDRGDSHTPAAVIFRSDLSRTESWRPLVAMGRMLGVPTIGGEGGGAGVSGLKELRE
jgi:hypothetical protein